MLMGDPARDHETLEAPKAAVKAAFESRDATRYRAALREALAAKVPAQDIPMVLRVAKLPESFLPHAAREDALRLEVCFVLDCTGSMGPQKAAVCQGIQLIAKEVQELNSSKLPRAKVALSMSCVVYNDFDEKSLKLGVPVVEVFKGRALRGEHTCALSPASFNLGGGFTERPEELVKFLERGLGHGGWTPEELTGALIAASHLPWSADCRICIVVTDAPCHGKAYHDKGEDPFTDSDTGLTLSGKPEVPLRTLKERKVKFCVLHTGDNVRKMISAFKNVVPGMKDSNEVSAQTMSGLVLSWARRHLEQQPLTYSVGAFGLMELDDTTVAAANHKLLLKSSGKDVSVLTDSEGLLWVGHPRQELGEKVTIAVTRPPDAALDAQYEAVSSTVDLCDSFQGDFTAECIMPLKTLS